MALSNLPPGVTERDIDDLYERDYQPEVEWCRGCAGDVRVNDEHVFIRGRLYHRGCTERCVYCGGIGKVTAMSDPMRDVIWIGCSPCEATGREPRR